MEKKDVVGYSLLVVVLAALVVSVFWISSNSSSDSLSGMSSVEMSSEGFSSNEEMMKAHHPEQSGMSSEGFSSYEEMMEAHHGSGVAASEDGCGGVAQGEGSSPLVGTKSKYGISYGNEGYKELMNAANMKLSAEQTKTIVGLAKTLAAKDVSRAEIQQEINNWKTVFYPNGASGATGAC